MLRAVRTPLTRSGFVRSVRFNSTIRELYDLKQFTQFVNVDKLSVVDFYATWCGPCKALEPVMEHLAAAAPEVQFARVDVDEAQDVAQEYAITAMPTCLYFKNGEQIDKVVGANPPKLAQLVQQHGNVELK